MAIGAQTAEGHDWSKVINAIVLQESGGNPNAVDKSGQCVGPMQMKKGMVDECNQILKARKSTKRFYYSDRTNLAKCKEMFVLIQSHFNKSNNESYAIRSWNVGLYYRQKYGEKDFLKKSQNYYECVRKKMSSI